MAVIYLRKGAFLSGGAGADTPLRNCFDYDFTDDVQRPREAGTDHSTRVQARNSGRAAWGAAGENAVVSSPTPPGTLPGPAPRHTRSTRNSRSLRSEEPHPAMSYAGSTGDMRGDACPHATPEGNQGCAPQPHAGGARTPLHPSPRSAGSTGTPIPLPPVEPSGHFDVWRDYLGLAATVAMLVRDAAGAPGNPWVPPGVLSPCVGPAPHAGPAPCARPVPRAGLVPHARPAPHARLGPCSFCQHNGEAPSMYESHSLRDTQGRLQCPVLRSYICPQCGATEDQAHTRRFCPLTHRGYTSVYSRPVRARSARRSRENPKM